MNDYYIVDAFTSTPFRGNTAAVVILTEAQSDEWMQRVATELNLTATAFIIKQHMRSLSLEDLNNPPPPNVLNPPVTPRGITPSYSIRWFTSNDEVDLCGHATLASAHVLWEQKIEQSDKIMFISKSGALPVNIVNEWVELDFPSIPPEPIENPPSYLAECFGLEQSSIKYTGKSKWSLLVEIDSTERLQNLNPDFSKLLKNSEYQSQKYQYIIVTAASSNEMFNFASRVFSPQNSTTIEQEPGTAHCTLAPYWKLKLNINNQSNQNQMVAYQSSKRGGLIKLRFKENDPSRIVISGKCVNFSKGTILASSDPKDWSEKSAFF